jgi:hypothetical protein
LEIIRGLRSLDAFCFYPIIVPAAVIKNLRKAPMEAYDVLLFRCEMLLHFLLIGGKFGRTVYQMTMPLI